MIKEWQEKVEAHLAEYAYFAPSQTYLFEALNLIQQQETEIDRLNRAIDNTNKSQRE